MDRLNPKRGIPPCLLTLRPYHDQFNGGHTQAQRKRRKDSVGLIFAPGDDPWPKKRRQIRNAYTGALHASIVGQSRRKKLSPRRLDTLPSLG